MQLAGLGGQRGHRHGVLQQPAEVGVMTVARARRAAPLRPQRRIAEQPLEQRAVAGLVDLAGEVLEEAVELVQVAIGDGEERRGVGALGALDRADLDLQLVAEALHEPLDAHQDAGPNALETGLDPEELRRRLIWGLDRLEGYVGVNNHMGSRFTAWEPGMAMVMQELGRRGLLFVDSRTVVGSAGARMAQRYGVPHADRDVFLDNEQDGAAVAERLMELEAVARRRGMAIGIGHPHDGTIAALAEWLPHLQEKGFILVPVSTIVERRMEQSAKTAAVMTGPRS